MPDVDAPTLATLVHHLQARSTLSAEERGALLSLPFRPSHDQAGSYLIRVGDPPSHCCVLLSGSAYRHKLAGDGARQILAIHFAGDPLGLGLGLLEASEHSVQTISPCHVAHIPHRAIVDIADRFPNIARAFWRESLVEASIAREWIVSLARGSARKRVAHLICELAIRQSTRMEDGTTIDLPLTQEQVGDATGLTSVHVNRTMQEMRGAGLIRTDKRALTILEWTQLQEVGEFSRGYLHFRTPPLAHLRAELPWSETGAAARPHRRAFE